MPALKAGLNFIRLATPTTDDRRLPAVLNNTSGFVYYVSITGITGSAAPDAGKVSAAVARIKRHTELPVGGRLRRPGRAEQARAIAAGADGVVVGSALVEAVRKSLDKTAGPRPGAYGRKRSPNWWRNWPRACAAPKGPWPRHKPWLPVGSGGPPPSDEQVSLFAVFNGYPARTGA